MQAHILLSTLALHGNVRFLTVVSGTVDMYKLMNIKGL